MAEHLIVGDNIAIPMREIDISAIRSQGAGGQNVNKVATAIHLQFDFSQSEALPPRVREKLAALDDHRVGETRITIKAQEFRSQTRNREAALERLRQLIESVMVEPKPRKATKPSRTSKKKRIDDKRRKGLLKKNRSRVSDD